MRANTVERTQERRTWLLTKLEEVKLLVEHYQPKTMYGFKPKSDHPLRHWVESHMTEAGYKPSSSWRSVWTTLQNDYRAIQKGWKPSEHIIHPVQVSSVGQLVQLSCTNNRCVYNSEGTCKTSMPDITMIIMPHGVRGINPQRMESVCRSFVTIEEPYMGSNTKARKEQRHKFVQANMAKMEELMKVEGVSGRAYRSMEIKTWINSIRETLGYSHRTVWHDIWFVLYKHYELICKQENTQV